MTDIIKKVCEAVGWELLAILDDVAQEWNCDNEDWRLERKRLHLYALVGCFEDLVREKCDSLSVECHSALTDVYTGIGTNSFYETVEHSDWLMAKLEALWLVWEKVK